MERGGKASKRQASRTSGSMEQSPTKSKGTPTAAGGSQEAPGSKRQCTPVPRHESTSTPVPRGAPSTGTPLTSVRGSGPNNIMLMTGGPVGQERVPGPPQGRSAVDVVPGRKPSGEGKPYGETTTAGRRDDVPVTSAVDVVPGSKPSGECKPSAETTAAGRRDDVPVVDHKDKFWMLDWVGEIREPSSGLVLYVVMKENIVPVGGLVRWTRQGAPSAMFELTMVLHGRGEKMPNVKHVALRWAKHVGFGKSMVDVFNPPGRAEVKLPDLVDVLGFFDSNVIAGGEPVVHPEDRISEPKCVLSKTVETGPSITIRDTPPAPKDEQIGEKGPCRGLVVPSAPMKSRPTATKAPVALGSHPRYVAATKGPLPLVGQQRYDYTVPSRAEKAHEYFGDDDEENSEEYSERAGGHEQYAVGVGDMTRRYGETSKVVGQDEDSEHAMSESGGEVGLAGGYGSSDEGCEGDVHPTRGGVHHETVVVATHTNAAGIVERKRKHRQERRSALDSKRSKQEAGQKRQLKLLSVDEAVQRTRETEAATKKKQQPKKRTAKGGVMEKTSVFPAEQPQSDEEAKGKTVTRPPSLRNVASVTSSGILSKGFFLELDEHGNQCPDMEFIYVKFDRILDIPDGEFRYNQRYFVQQTIDGIYDAMVALGEAAIRERMTKAVLLLVPLRDTLHTNASGRIVRARRVLRDEFELGSVNKYYYYPLSGQHNVTAARRCFVERPDIAQELRLDRWTARPVYYPDKSMDNYGTLSTFQNAKDKWNTPPHQIVVIQNILKLRHTSNCHEAKGGSAAEVKNADYRNFAGKTLRLTGFFTFFKRVTSWDIHIHLSILKWTRRQQTKAKHSYKVANLTLEDIDKMVVIMYSNDGDYHRNTIPLLEDIPASTPAADRSSGEQAGDLSALVRRERRPKMLPDVVEKNFTPTKLKMAGMEPKEKFVYKGMEREPNAMVETLEHFCPADEVVVFLGKGHAALIWELLKSHRHCIVLERKGMKFEFLVQFVNRMVKSGGYFTKLVKLPPRHDEKRNLVYKVGQNIVNIWEFLFEIKPQNRGERAYVARRRKMKSLLRGYHKAPAETEVAFLDRLEMMYFDEHIGAFTIVAYATCFGEGFDAEDSEEESEDGTLQAALADERQKTCSSASQEMGAPGTSSGSGGASSMAVSTDQLPNRPSTSSLMQVTPSYMAGNTTALPSGAVRYDPRVQAMLSQEVMASLSALAHSPTTVLELLCSQTPQQPPSEPLEYEIEDMIPPDIARLPGPIVCQDNYTVMLDNVWGHHII
ncbi:hypothetical protein CBR_g36960 [Chara braunii]|uniref:Uncharacterized protein n=1 Tax=Chara braunii TaxID=69332 RepID=A0A388JZH9_CHABU|nr:hypothetical protein CBR_g36960 [Chara braunii]|eukprot:GBG63192.1 hypothetical protein CBR_g36960 [Chara braunii]